MGYILKNIKKYIFIYCLFVKNCLIAQMEYRINFVFGFTVECTFLFLKTLYAIVVYSMNITINGLSPDAVLLFVGTYTLMTGFMSACFFMNFMKIPEYVREGSFDMFITKPVSLQFMVTLRHFDLAGATPNLIGGVTMIAIAWNRLDLTLNLVNIVGYSVLVISGVLMTYSLLLFPPLLSFWIVKTNSINDVTYALWDFNNMPMGIYNKWIQRIGVFIIPIFIISNFPSKFLLGEMNPVYLVWAVVAPVMFMILVRMFWNFAIRNYTSASS